MSTVAEPKELSRKQRFALPPHHRRIYLPDPVVRRNGRDIHVGFKSNDTTLLEGRYNRLVNQSDEPILLVINRSIGGSLNAAYHIGDVFRKSPVPVSALVTEMCLSAAFLILQSCSYRVMYPTAQVGFHNSYNLYRTDADTTMAEARRMAEELLRSPKEHRRERERIIRLLQRRMEHLKRDDILKLMRDAKIMSATTALRSRYIDEIVLPESSV